VEREGNKRKKIINNPTRVGGEWQKYSNSLSVPANFQFLVLLRRGSVLRMAMEEFALCWNKLKFAENLSTGFQSLFDRGDFVDCTIACDGRLLQCHKLVLAICSPYFKEMFMSNPCQHPISKSLCRKHFSRLYLISIGSALEFFLSKPNRVINNFRMGLSSFFLCQFNCPKISNICVFVIGKKFPLFSASRVRMLRQWKRKFRYQIFGVKSINTTEKSDKCS
jgi:BTB/POZ domain